MKVPKRKSLAYIILVLVLTVVFANTFQVSISNSSQRSSVNLRTNNANDDIDILLLMDDTYGGNYQGIINKFEQFGWNITIAVLASKISLTLYDEDSDGIFNKTISNLLPIIYSIDIELSDIFFNSIIYTNETLLDNLNTGTVSLLLPITALIIIVNLYLIFKKRRT